MRSSSFEFESEKSSSRNVCVSSPKFPLASLNVEKFNKVGREKFVCVTKFESFCVQSLDSDERFLGVRGKLEPDYFVADVKNLTAPKTFDATTSENFHLQTEILANLFTFRNFPRASSQRRSEWWVKEFSILSK